jgi:hypothetical protein
MAEFYVVARWSDGSVTHEAIQLDMRAHTAPMENGWELGKDGVFHRQPTIMVIEGYLARQAKRRAAEGLTLVGWRQLTLAEHHEFERDRTYRNAMEDVGGKLRHNMNKARELHRDHLRHLNGERFLTLDREWLDASASGDKRAADAAEAKRKARRDLVNDPRIDAAQTIEELKQIVPADD